MIARLGRAAAVAALIPALGWAVAPAAAQEAAPTEKTFATPEEAIAALRTAAESEDKDALDKIFGPDFRSLRTGDAKQDRADARRFAQAVAEGAKPVSEGDGNIVLEVGANRWPFPIPLVPAGSGWRFDTAAGKEEIVDRHIGRDELHAIGALRAYARARSGGGTPPVPAARHGYAFKALVRQGDAAPGGAMDYVPGSQDGGFALAAYPEHWGKSGVMTFVVDRDGVVSQKNLGESTASAARSMIKYDPDAGWAKVSEPGVADR